MSQFEEDTAAANKFLADTARANELFVEAAKLMMKSQDPESKGRERYRWLEEGFHCLTKIIENYSSTDLAVKLISGQSVGGISLESYGEEISYWEKHGGSKPASGESILDEAAGALSEAGADQRDAEAAKRYREAAEQGHVEAQFNLGHMYFMGKGVPENDAEAFKWWREAAEQGHADAQYELGHMYYNGWSVPENDAEAFAWWRKAAGQGHERAKERLEKLEAK